MIQLALIIVFILPFLMLNYNYIIYRIFINKYLDTLYNYINNDNIYLKNTTNNIHYIYITSFYPTSYMNINNEVILFNQLILKKHENYHPIFKLYDTFIRINKNDKLVIKVTFTISNFSLISKFFLLFNIYSTHTININLNTIVVNYEVVNFFTSDETYNYSIKNKYPDFIEKLKNLKDKDFSIVALKTN